MATCIIVDDSKFMRKIIHDALVKGGHKVLAEASDGIDGINKTKKLDPDFITMDITMDGKGGITAINEINSSNPGTKIIVISALSQDTIQLSDSSINVSAYITKPFDSKKLLDTIRQALNK